MALRELFYYILFIYLPHNKLIQTMSLQRLKNVKNVTYSDRYSKNPIINNLIKNKLETEMISIKESVANIIAKDPDSNLTKTAARPLRRNKSYSINPKSIKQAIQYNPLQRLTKITQQFIANRQTDSFLVGVNQLKEINNAREEYLNLNNKWTKNDELKYENQNNWQEMNSKIRQATIKEYSENVWLPEQPQIQYLIEDKITQIDEEFILERKRKNFHIIDNQLDRFSNRLIGKSVQSLKNINDQPLNVGKHQNGQFKVASYNHLKYHKNDYKALEMWLQNSLKAIDKQQAKPQSKLNMVYSCYISIWKQIIRLTYIQNEEKGLIMQKMFYSMLRLFWGLISEQQALSRSYLNQSDSDHSKIKRLMQERMEELNKRFQKYNKEIEQLKNTNLKLSRVFISYQKVNEGLVDELEKITKEKKDIQREFYNIGNSFLKALQILHDRHLVDLDFTEERNEHKPKRIANRTQFKSYFLFDDNSKPIVLARFKSEQSGPRSHTRYISNQLEPTVSEEMRRYNERYGNTIKGIDNEISRFWQKKQNDLEIKGIINSLVLQIRVKDASVGTTQTFSEDFSSQFPENNENYIEKLLTQQKNELTTKFSNEKSKLEVIIQQKQSIFQMWKSNAEEMQQKNKTLHQNNSKLNETIKKVKESQLQMSRQMSETLKIQQQKQDQIEELRKQLQIAKSEQELAKLCQKNAEREKQVIQKQIERQKENNMMLVRANLEMKQKVEKFQIKYTSIHKAIKAIAPWLEKFMAQVDRPAQQIQINVLKTISQKIQQYLSDYVTKDSSLFMTRLI